MVEYRTTIRRRVRIRILPLTFVFQPIQLLMGPWGNLFAMGTAKAPSCDAIQITPLLAEATETGVCSFAQTLYAAYL